MYNVKPDGSIECVTPQEALELQRLIHAARPPAQLAVQPAASRVAPLIPPRQSNANGNEAPPEIVRLLKQFDGTKINSAQLGPIIGALSSAGVGPKLYQLRKRLPIDDYVDLRKHRDEKGVVTWRVRFK